MKWIITAILLQEGKEVGRVPAIVAGKVQKFMFKEEEVVQTFDLNNLYAEARKDKRYAAQIKAMDEKAAQEQEESKKTKWIRCYAIIRNTGKFSTE